MKDSLALKKELFKQTLNKSGYKISTLLLNSR